MKIGDRVRVRLSPHRTEEWRIESWIKRHWWHTGTVVDVGPGPWPILVERSDSGQPFNLRVTLDRANGGLVHIDTSGSPNRFPYHPDELEVL